MGRPRKPDKVQEISGAWKKDPQRRRKPAAELLNAAALGDPPVEWATEAEHNARCAALLRNWQQIVDQDRVLKVLNCSHRVLVETTCLLMYKIRRASMGYGKATSGDYARITSHLAAMGMTPIDSPKVAEAVRAPERGGSGGAGRSGGWGELVG